MNNNITSIMLNENENMAKVTHVAEEGGEEDKEKVVSELRRGLEYENTTGRSNLFKCPVISWTNSSPKSGLLAKPNRWRLLYQKCKPLLSRPLGAKISKAG